MNLNILISSNLLVVGNTGQPIKVLEQLVARWEESIAGIHGGTRGNTCDRGLARGRHGHPERLPEDVGLGQ